LDSFPTDKTFMLYSLEQNKQYARAEICAGQDIVESTVMEYLKIELTDLSGLSLEPGLSKH